MGWLDPGTCGVKLAEFEHMTQQLTQAAPKLAGLADKLWQALNTAQVSTAPAMEIKRIAAWADEAASDMEPSEARPHHLSPRRRLRQLLAPDRDRACLFGPLGVLFTLPTARYGGAVTGRIHRPSR
ncbi:hypothetical protein [Actinomadura sp. BRA 177]|uniref:hypothetical protein n=1 Tax=Actinomadura sp. BRA 177 TaxID=2745202 RepID=UPI001595D02C|nr:hypothetical protein [Actinomadura sp. BRA 177]NVI89441.1 hypothetical protein [Actinomadura sp. BRA 177]